jgi:hypothetical protein
MCIVKHWVILGHEITPNEECMFELEEIRGHKLSINVVEMEDHNCLQRP